MEGCSTEFIGPTANKENDFIHLKNNRCFLRISLFRINRVILDENLFSIDELIVRQEFRLIVVDFLSIKGNSR
jgi:hypothetical protein